MAKVVWYYQMMGAEIGPLTSAQLVEKVKVGQVQPDTLVRQGADGKWIPADRWKGLLPKPEEELPPAPPPTVKPSGVKPEPESEPELSQDATSAAAVTPEETTASGDESNDDAYHLKGDSSEAFHAIHRDGFEFFEMVGFHQAITPTLYAVLCEHSAKHKQTITQITRRALAQFLGRPELGEGKPPTDAPPADAPTANADNSPK